MTPNKVIQVFLPKPHSSQLEVLKGAKRFNVLSNGRRWGKSTLSERLIKPTITEKWRVGFWTPTHKDIEPTWQSLCSRLKDIIKHKNTQQHVLELTTGGIIDFWSMDDPDSGRGRAYHRAIIDEFCKAKNGKYAWEKTIRPTLTDFKGDAWILSTPKGTNHYFYELFHNEEKFSDWTSWQLPTTANPYIDPLEVEEARAQLDSLSFRQEYLAEFVSAADRPFMYCFEDRHISELAEYKPRQIIYLSFDFNVNPMTCSISQEGVHPNGTPFIHFIDEVYLPNSDIKEVCAHILAKYPDAAPPQFMVTGDRSGGNRSGLMKNVNYYTEIKRGLNIREGQVKVPTNPYLSDSIVLCNSILANHPEILFHPRCKETIHDMRFVEWDGTKIIKDPNKNRAHILDCVRYRLSTFNNHFLKGRR